MSNIIIASFANLPIELIYRILDQLDPLNILISVHGVCTQFDQIIDTYDPYQVNFTIMHAKDSSHVIDCG
jgi:hypothetical protein